MTHPEYSFLQRHLVETGDKEHAYQRGLEVEKHAEKYLGARWIPGGYNRNGVDCIGLMIAIAFDMNLYDKSQVEVPRYSQVPSGRTMLSLISKYLRRLPGPEFGSVVTFAQTGTNLYHIGIIGARYFYQAALEYKSVTKSTLTEMCLQDRRVCFAFEKVRERV